MKFYGQFNPPVDKVLYDRYFKNKKNGVSIECGALDGVWASSTKFFEENFNWKTINIEPLSVAFDKLIINRPESINLKLALSNNNLSKEFINFIHPKFKNFWGNGSISHTNEHKKYLEKICGDKNYEVYNVKCITYKDLIKELKLEKLDLFVLDVEGHEYQVIDGMVDATIFPDIFVIEHGHKTPQDIDKKLQILPVKYKLDYVSFVNSYFIKDK